VAESKGVKIMTYNSYQTPIKGLFICGSAAHPGGGVMGSPGRNCANFILDFVL
jgi:phytoene dehydrogenase-like protein